MANTIQIKHSPNDVAPASMSGSTHDLAKGELAWVDHSSNAGGANGKLYIGDATAAGAVQRHIGGVGTGAVSAAAAAGSLTGSTLASGVTASRLTSLGTIATLTATDYVIGGHTVSDIDRGGEFNDVEDHVMSSAGVNDRIEAIALLDSECTDLAAVKAFTGEAAATADQTDAEIRTAVEAASDSNVFTDADHSKLNGIEASATADQTKSDIDGLAITTVGAIDSGSWTATDIAVSHGGTGASSASDARTNLGLAIGSDVQAYHATLAAVAGSTYTGDNAITTLGTIGTGVWQGTAISLSLIHI